MILETGALDTGGPPDCPDALPGFAGNREERTCVRAVIGVALDFWTRRPTREGLDDATAVETMTEAVAALAASARRA